MITYNSIPSYFDRNLFKYQYFRTFPFTSFIRKIAKKFLQLNNVKIGKYWCSEMYLQKLEFRLMRSYIWCILLQTLNINDFNRVSVNIFTFFLNIEPFDFGGMTYEVIQWALNIYQEKFVKFSYIKFRAFKYFNRMPFTTTNSEK